VTLHVRGRLDADDGDVLTQWVLEGLGISLKPVFEIAGHLRSGALRPVLLDAPPATATLAVVYPHRRLLPRKVSLLADFLIAEIGPVVRQSVAGLDVGALA
jgi:DNA-binding transcriptional LysR family regulator